MQIADFHNLHAGQTALLVGNGENLKLTPPEWFDYPSFGLNTCHLWRGEWKPTYYTAVDNRLYREFGVAVYEKFMDIPKFIPYPNLNTWKGENFYRFYHRPGSLWPANRQTLWPSGFLTDTGVAFGNIMHVAMQLAFFMGFKTLLMIGVAHRPDRAQAHFWGIDRGSNANPPITNNWFEGYKILVNGMKSCGVEVLNISENTYVPENILPRGDWRQYATSEISTRLSGQGNERSVLQAGAGS